MKIYRLLLIAMLHLGPLAIFGHPTPAQPTKTTPRANEENPEKEKDDNYFYQKIPQDIRSSWETISYCITKCREYFYWGTQQVKDYWDTGVHTKNWIQKHPFQAGALAFGIGGVYTRNKYAAIIVSVAMFVGYKRYLLQRRYIGHVESQANGLANPRESGDVFTDQSLSCNYCYRPSIIATICSNCQQQYCQECITSIKYSNNYYCPYCGSFLSAMMRHNVSALPITIQYTTKGFLTNSHQ